MDFSVPVSSIHCITLSMKEVRCFQNCMNSESPSHIDRLSRSSSSCTDDDGRRTGGGGGGGTLNLGALEGPGCDCEPDG